MSGRDSVTSAAPGWSMTRSPSIPDFPDRGSDKMRVWSSARAKIAAAVLGAAEPDGVLGGAGQGAVVQPHRRAGPAAVVQRGEPGPADGQLGQGGEPGSGPQPDHDPPPHPPYPLRGEQRAPGGYRHYQAIASRMMTRRADVAAARASATAAGSGRWSMTGSRRGCRGCRRRRCGRRGRLSRTRSGAGRWPASAPGSRAATVPPPRSRRGSHQRAGR